MHWPHALKVAQEAHKDQKRKYVDEKGEQELYINHPLRVAQKIINVNAKSSIPTPSITLDRLKVIAVLHDLFEDTDYPIHAIRSYFGDLVTDSILQLTNDKHLTKEQQKNAQIYNVESYNDYARVVKLADMYDNLSGLFRNEIPQGWSEERVIDYFKHKRQVTDVYLHTTRFNKTFWEIEYKLLNAVNYIINQFESREKEQEEEREKYRYDDRIDPLNYGNYCDHEDEIPTM